MKNKKLESIILIVVGLIIIGAGLYIYFVAHTIYPHSNSSRVRHLNWLLDTFGKNGTSVLFGFIGLAILYVGVKKLIK